MRPRLALPVAFVALHALAALTVLVAPAAAGVLTVSGSGGADFTEISAAVAAAHEGDIILVEPPAADAYAAFTVDGLSLTITVAHDGDFVPTRQIWVKNLAAGQSVVLRGFVVAPLTSAQAPALRIDSCVGALRVEHCRLTGSQSPSLVNSGQPAILATSAGDLGVTTCELEGGAGCSSISNDWDATSGGAALQLAAGSTWVHDSVLTGGRGGNHEDPDLQPGDNYQPGDGGAGARLAGGAELSISGCTLTGGDGGQQIVGWAHGLAGPAVYEVSSSTLRRRDSVLLSGSDTAPHYDVPPIQMLASDIQTLHAEARHLAAPSPKREGETLDVTVDGKHSDLALLVFGLAAQGHWLPGLQGPLLVDPAGATSIVLGSIELTGELHAAFPVPGLPPGIDGLDVHLQLAIASGGLLTLENGSVVVLLDSAF